MENNENKNKLIINRIVKSAIIAALYVVLTFVSYPIAYANIQFRISELLLLICFFNRDYVIGLTIATFLVNLASPFMPWDLLVGTSATAIACLLISFSKHLAIAALFPIITNSFLVGILYRLLLGTNYWLGVGYIAIGEATVLIVGYIIFLFIFKNEKMKQLIGANRNLAYKW